MRKEIYKDGTIYYFSEDGRLDRADGPAVEKANGEKWWYKKGLIHREDGPAEEYSNGKKEYWLNGKWLENVTSDDELAIYWILQ